VLVDTSDSRCRFARELLQHRPSLIRANANEIAALAGGGEHAAERLARSTGAVVAQSGACDLITDGEQSVRIENGHPWMARVTALGCAGSALAAAFLALDEQATTAAVQSLLALSVAGEIAAEQAAGPGSFQLVLLDSLYRLDFQTLHKRVRIYE
jgi:hydroxyethylthiazole kinase